MKVIALAELPEPVKKTEYYDFFSYKSSKFILITNFLYKNYKFIENPGFASAGGRRSR